jgi:hypothetical protein
MSELTQMLGRIERAGEGGVALFDRAYATSPEDLWQACTDPERLARCPDGDGSRLVLRHERLTGAQVAGYAAGWDTYLRSLEAHLDGTPAPDWGETWSALHELYASAG